MAEKYHCLPSEILEKGSTLDIQIHVHAMSHQDRMRKKAKGEDITSTFKQDELVEMRNRGLESAQTDY
jgi:hypothetical protein|tara:strand:+ start:805 stop:1008 length:204 start_codon:yes stop_codon:yes gene_type:complete